MASLRDIESSWNNEYARGRYRNEPPLAFVDDILGAVRRHQLIDHLGLYVGCGNGRNYLRLVDQGLDLIGLDISGIAIEQLASRIPNSDRLVRGDLASLAPDERYGLVVGIQVFQHGDREQAHRHLLDACDRVEVGGLFALRVNAADTQLEYDHEVTEQTQGGSFTVRYLEGPKKGLLIHFFDRDELAGLMGDPFEVELPLRLAHTERIPAAHGRWSQWEAIWRRK